MKRKFFILTLASCLVAAHCSIATAGFFDDLDQSNNQARLITYGQVKDKSLVNYFYSISEDGKIEALNSAIPLTSGYKFRHLSEGALTLRRQIFKANNLREIQSEMSRYAMSPMDDVIGQRYVAFAYSRGNTVRQYKPALSVALNSMFAQHFQFTGRDVINFFDIENALIEFSPDQKIVSAMTRSHQALGGYETRSWQYINIIFGSGNTNLIENKLSNNFFDNNFQRVIFPEAGKPQ